jgi:PhnB protein
MKRIVPMLAYGDAPKAIEFLCRAFGFQERFRLDMPDGRIGHAEIESDGCVIMLASAWREAGLHPPSELDGLHAQIYCEVEDVDAHFRRARDAGATIAAEPADQFHGSRSYRAVDPEGHRWIFSMVQREVSPDEMQKLIK